MRARFIGDPNHGGEGPKTLPLYGINFPHSEWVSIEGNAMAMQKLPGNNHFQVDAGVAAKPAPAVKPVSTVEPVKNKGGRPRKNPVITNPPPPPVDPIPDTTNPTSDDDGFSDTD